MVGTYVEVVHYFQMATAVVEILHHIFLFAKYTDSCGVV